VLRCSPEELRELVLFPEHFYLARQVRRGRKSQRWRHVWRVSDPLRRIQREIALWLRPVIQEQGWWVTAYRPGASAFMNALQHAGAARVVVADLADFYGSISMLRVISMFERLGCSRQVAVTLARLTTFRNQLPPGGRASPYIANLVAEDLDAAFLSVIPAIATYTRYADDVTVSVPSGTWPSVQDVDALIAAAGFRPRQGSIRVRQRDEGPFVTGFQVENERPRLPRRLRRMIERYIRVATSYGRSHVTDPRLGANWRERERRVRGVINWTRAIDPALAQSWDLRLALCDT
jgi:RNA-directed DNA polymerase